MLTLAHKIVTTGKAENIYRRIVSPYAYNTRAATGNELRAWAGTVRARNRTALTHSTFNNQAIQYYNRIPPEMRSYSQARFKCAAKRWARENIA